ncbi:MAG: KamA family radical SAM protein [SAR324 cluster bacterium]|nr:KamA family radical SAM protein [SAR324 cluster bacterium]
MYSGIDQHLILEWSLRLKISLATKKQGVDALKQVISRETVLSQQLKLDVEQLRAITREYRVRIPEYYLNLIEAPDDPIWKQSVPDERELDSDNLPEDPFLEDDPHYSPVPHLTHRYPDRVLLLVTDQCPMYCRYCMRKRKTQKHGGVTRSTIQQGIAYIQRTPAVREVILSGGDPLMLADSLLERILRQIRAVEHVEILRIHTRMPCVLPQRVTPELARMIARFHPLFMVVHFNHPRELTPEAKTALGYLADAGIPLNNQSVLLKGVNDDPVVLRTLCLELLKSRVRPYYLHQADLVHGTDHFRTRVETGLEIMRSLRGQISGLAVPQYVLDGPGGGGKIPLYPDDQQVVLEEKVILKNCDGGNMEYPQVAKD